MTAIHNIRETISIKLATVYEHLCLYTYSFNVNNTNLCG